MKTKAEIQQAITQMTNTIHQQYPELSNYILENPIKVSGDDAKDAGNLEIYLHSLQELVDNYIHTDVDAVTKLQNKPSDFPGYPIYPSSNDIYHKDKEESELNPEDLSKKNRRIHPIIR